MGCRPDNSGRHPIFTKFTMMIIEGIKFTAHHIPTPNTAILMISGKNGFLACGYIKIEVANKRGDVCAIVTGVKNHDDMLVAKVVAISQAARKAGIKEGMPGKEALLMMQ